MNLANQQKIIFLLLAILLLVIIYLARQKDNFTNTATNGTNFFTDPRYEKNRTQLYGSLFLDNLDAQIKNMTDPPIKYDTKRIDIIKYEDVLL